MDNPELFLEKKKALFLDMNSTFMFGEDRFDDLEDYSIYYHGIGGSLTKIEINSIINDIYAYLEPKYADVKYREHFPSIAHALRKTCKYDLSQAEKERIIETFAYHELGSIAPEYAEALRMLAGKFTLAAIVDIWAPKYLWLNTLKSAQIIDVFSVLSFSSDHGYVKPSPYAFNTVLKKLKLKSRDVLMIGDSPQRDLAGAKAAGIDCALVGKAKHSEAVASFNNLLELAKFVPGHLI